MNSSQPEYIALSFCTRNSKTRRMAIANGTCVSFCNQPKAHYLATSRESRRYIVVGCRYLATSREPKAHFGLPWLLPWDNRGKFHMDRKRIQCLSNASQHVPIYLQPFPSNSTRKFNSSPFYHIFAHFGLPWVRPMLGLGLGLVVIL